jgi:hypothetical protein
LLEAYGRLIIIFYSVFYFLGFRTKFYSCCSTGLIRNAARLSYNFFNEAMKRRPLIVLLPGLFLVLNPDAPLYATAWEVACESSSWKAVVNNAFAEHETLSYAVKWAGIKAGKGTIAVDGLENEKGRSVYHLSMELSTSGMTGALHQYRERTDTWLDKESLLTFRYTKKTREGSYARDEEVTLDQACRRFDRYERRLDKGTEERKQARLPAETLDILGYLFYLRTLPLAEGGHYDLMLLSGDKLYPVTVNVIRRLKISSKAGWFDCFYLVPTLRAGVPPDLKLKQLEVWVSADPRHVPVRLRMEANVGHITAELIRIGSAPTSPG